jgi:hypothetical protein
MKRIVLLLIAAFIGLTAFPQQKHNGKIVPANKVNQVRKKPFRNAIKDVDGTTGGSLHSPYKPKAILAEESIGQTRYDLQTNQSVQNRVYAFPDGTVGAVWTRGISDPGFADRGSGYNYNDGTTWGPAPTARIETSKAGWPSYQPYGPNGEMVVTHHNTAGLIICKRDTKGNGAWTESILPGPTGAVDISWPRTVTSGLNHDKIHVIATTYSAYQGLNLALLYYRSLDGGLTWDQQHVVLPGMTSANYKGFAGDCYAMAQPVGDNLAFVVGDNWVDLFLMKSTDGGTTWTKTVIAPHPYPMFDETTTLVLDTPTVCDGSVAVALDQNGKAHVSFGLMKVLNEDLTDGTTSYFPYTDGLVYWKEDMPQLTSLDYETLEQSGNLIASTPDLNGNDTILEYVGLGTYYLSVTSMPSIAWVMGEVYLAYTTVMEHMDNGTQNYRHIWSRRSYNNGVDWTEPYNENSSIVHNFDECVFPCLSPTDKGQFIPMSYQYDEEPGMAVRGDDPPDPYTDNTIVVKDYLKHIDGGFNELENLDFAVYQNYPNPSNGLTNIPVELMKPANLELSVIDNLGRTVHSKIISNSGIGKKIITLDTKMWNAGVYYYIFKTEKQIITRKLTVQ